MNETQILKILIDKMFEIAGYNVKYEDVVGTTAQSDLMIRKIAGIIKVTPEYTSLLIKVIILTLTIILL